MLQLWHQREELEKLDVQVKIVTFDGDILGKNYLQASEIDWPLLVDTELDLYQAYGLERGSWWAIYGPTSIAKYLRLIFTGQTPGKPGKDWRQMGGDVLVNPAGRVAFLNRSETPHDRPDISRVLHEIVATASR